MPQFTWKNIGNFLINRMMFTQADPLLEEEEEICENWTALQQTGEDMIWEFPTTIE